MPPVSGADGLYGPPLGELLGPQGLNLSQPSIPSRDEVRQAIYTLSDPQNVSYMTFSTILAMDRVPACNHLDLLASDASIFPSCIKLLRKYCHVERRGLFDHAYGLLCIQTIILSVQVAILLQTNQLESFLKGIQNKPHGSSIFSLLDEWVLKAEENAAFGPGRRGTPWLLGWYDEEIAGRSWKSCLPQIGGFSINDAKFIVEQTWSARADFLSVASVAGRRFHGWGSFMHVIWRILGISYGLGSGDFGGPEPRTSDQRQCWIHFVDIGSRYALCSSEAEDFLMPAFLANSPSFSQLWRVKEPGSALGVLDSSRMVQTLVTKLGTRPKLHIAFSSMLFGYVCKNLKPSDAEANNTVSQASHAILERSWEEVTRIPELNSEQFEDFLGCITHILSNAMGILHADSELTRYTVEAFSDELFVEFLGRFLLSPLLATKGLSNMRTHVISIAQSNLAKLLLGFVASIKTFSLHENFSSYYFMTWHKIACHIDYCLLMLDTPQFLIERHLYPWQRCWSMFGLALALEERFRPKFQCGYSRCAAPNSVQLWECSGCESKWYCSQRCRNADWVGQPGPHMHRCGSLPQQKP